MMSDLGLTNFGGLSAPIEPLSVFDRYLGSTSSPTQGAGLMGYTRGIGYAAGSVGNALDNASPVVPFYPGLTSDDALALQTFASFNQGQRIIIPRGATLNFFTQCTIQWGGTYIDWNGATVFQHTPNIDSVVFQPTTAGVTAAFLNGGGMGNGTISHALVAATSTQGNAFKNVQCNGLRIENMTFNDGDVTQAGGQFMRYNGCSFFAANGSNRGSGTALVHFQDAIYGGTNYQKPFTSVVENWKASATKLRDAIFRIHSGDGINIGEGYGGNGASCICLLLSDHTNSSIASCSIIGAYLDCVNPSTGTPNVIEIRDDGDATSWVYGLIVANNWMGNGSGVGILCRKANVQALTIIGNVVVNMVSWMFDLQGSSSTDYVISGNQSQNNFGCRFAGNGGTLTFTGNGFNNTTGTVCLSISAGTWTTGAITGNVNSSAGVADYALNVSTTFTNGLSVVGNGSAYPATSPTQSWRIPMIPLASFANNAAAISAGYTSSNMFYKVGNVVQAT